MDLINENTLPLKVLVEFLDDDASDLKLSPEDWRRVEQKFGKKINAEILFLLTQIEFDEDEARKHWYKILEHRLVLNKALNRDVGLRVALCDYFTNIRPMLKNLVFVEANLFLQKERSILLDELTGLYNRRFFNSVIKKEVEYARRFDRPFSLLIIDVDDFKAFNDILGHHAGDRALAELGRVLYQTGRIIDHVIRYGGDEFVIILPLCDKEKAGAVAERHRVAVENHAFAEQDRLPSKNLTVSVGVSNFPIDGQDGLDLFQRADEALYRGKKEGRNKVGSSAPDKRQYLRHPLYSDLLFRLDDMKDDDSFQRATAQNISQGGLLCRIDQPVELNQTLEIVLNSVHDNSINLKARSVRLAKGRDDDHAYHLGVSFDIKSPEEEESLRKFIEAEIRHSIRNSTLHSNGL
ncbi:MAG: diguanylate cyclase [Deltaproteobacteria bacterium]|nr:diguanylate cyclase [Deltaproteobacteria bacterium]